MLTCYNIGELLKKALSGFLLRNESQVKISDQRSYILVASSKCVLEWEHVAVVNNGLGTHRQNGQ